MNASPRERNAPGEPTRPANAQYRTFAIDVAVSLLERGANLTPLRGLTIVSMFLFGAGLMARPGAGSTISPSLGASYPMIVARVTLQAIGALKFGADGMLYVADSRVGAIYAIDVAGSVRDTSSSGLTVESIDEKIAAAVGVPQSEIRIREKTIPLLPSGIQASGIGDGGPATSARLIAPSKAIVDRQGNIYVTERAAYRIRRIDARTGVITTFAGTGERGYSGDGGPATAARLEQLSGMTLDSAGNLFVGDLWNSRIRRVDVRTGIITTVVGTGVAGYSGDGGPARDAKISAAFDLTFDRAGNLIFTDTENHRIRRVDARTGVITTIAGDGRWGFSGEGGPATSASLARPHCVMIADNDDITICDSFNHRIRRIDARTGVITTIVGTGLFGGAGDDGPATHAAITYVGDFAIDRTGSLIFSDVATHRIRRVDRRTGIITTIAGSGTATYAGDGGPAAAASFDQPSGLTVDSAGNVLVVDMWNGRVRRIDVITSTLTTIAGSAPSPETPDWRFRVTYDGSATRRLNNRPPALELPNSESVAIDDLSYAREPGWLPGAVSVVRPAGGAGERYPVIVLLHGRTNQESRPRLAGGMVGWAKLFAASGAVVLLIDHRLGIGTASAERSMQDVRSALAAARAASQRIRADFDRVCVVAFSDGIAPIVPLIDDGTVRPRCIVAFYPHLQVSDTRMTAWDREPTEIRTRMSFFGLLPRNDLTFPMFIARAGRDRPEVNEPIAQLQLQAATLLRPVTIMTHDSGQAGFERVLADETAKRVVRDAITFAMERLRR
jgi:sugar lactone lactonase YvrE/acetyl esterase/lipase